MENRGFHRLNKFTLLIGFLTISKFDNLNANVLAYEYTSQLSLSTVSSSIQQNESTKIPATTTTTTTAENRQQKRQQSDGIGTTIPSSDMTQSIDTLTNSISWSSALSSLTSSSSSTPDVGHTRSILTTFEIDAIEKPIDVGHEYIGSSGPDKKESDAIQKALDWLKEKRSADYGWNNDTHMVILAKELSGDRDLTDTSDSHVQIIEDLEDLLSVKQMMVEILMLLDHHHHSVIPKAMNVDKIARYVLALGSLCQDPKHFLNQHDLLAILQHHEPNEDNTFALSALATCSLGEHVRKRQIRRLLDIANDFTAEQSIETIAMVILALRCVITDHHHRHLEHFVRKPAIRLAQLQGITGDFGSLKNTALAMQALQDLDEKISSQWSRSDASKWLLDRQRTDGGWTEKPLADGQDPSIGIGLTASIILALGRKGLGVVRVLQCNHILSETNTMRLETSDLKLATPVGLTSSTLNPDTNNNISFTIVIWFSNEINDSLSIKLRTSQNTTFYQAMVQAADTDARFAFEAHDWPNGHYIHRLADHEEEPRKFNYWLLYHLDSMPDMKNPPGNQFITTIGVDELIVDNNSYYLYWFKKL